MENSGLTSAFRGAQATWRMCENEENSALRGPIRLWHGSERNVSLCPKSAPRKAVILEQGCTAALQRLYR